MSNSPKVSKLRWTTGSPAKAGEELAIQGTPAIWDCGNLIAANEKYVAFPSSSAGSVALLSHDKVGIRGFVPKKLFGQKGHVIDLAFSPFSSDILMTASEDGTIRGWKIPEGGITADTEDSLISLNGHSRKCGLLAFHPSASNVLASAGMDGVINLWDITQGAPKASFTAGSGDNQIMSLNWNLDGSLLNFTAKDKMVHIVDSRTGKVVVSTKANEGSKTMRSLWCKRRNQIVTFGFNKSQFRQMMLFDVRSMDKPQFIREVDQMSNIMLPFFDEDTNLLYVGGRGEAGIKYFEIWDEAQAIQPLQAFSHGDPQKGLAILPKTSMDVKACQLAKFYKLTNNKLTTVSFNLPRRQAETQFQADLYPNTFADKPSITSEDFFAGKNAVPTEVSLEAKFEGGDIQVVAASGQLSPPSSAVNSPTSSKPPVNNNNNNSGAAAVASAQEESKKEEIPVVVKKSEVEAEPVVAVVVVATPEEPKKSELEILNESLVAQQQKVAEAQKVLDAETAKLDEIQKQVDAFKAANEKPPAVEAVEVAVPEVKTETETTAAAVEKTEEAAVAPVVAEKTEEVAVTEKTEEVAEPAAAEKTEETVAPVVAEKTEEAAEPAKTVDSDI